MPLKKGGGKKAVPASIKEMHKGPLYAKVKAHKGKKVADKMAVAAAFSASRKKKGK